MNAWLAFLDESGLLMAPLLRRTWSLRGQTPIPHQRTRSHQKVSIIGALCISPDRDRVHLYFRLHPDANVDAGRVMDFLRQLHRQLGAPVLLIWDRLPAHRAKVVHGFLRETPEIVPFFLPPYAPELNPPEYVWGHLKGHSLVNVPFFDVDTLAANTRRQARSLQRKPDLLRSFLSHSPLSLHLR